MYGQVQALSRLQTLRERSAAATGTPAKAADEKAAYLERKRQDLGRLQAAALASSADHELIMSFSVDAL